MADQRYFQVRRLLRDAACARGLVKCLTDDGHSLTDICAVLFGSGEQPSVDGEYIVIMPLMATEESHGIRISASRIEMSHGNETTENFVETLISHAIDLMCLSLQVSFVINMLTNAHTSTLKTFYHRQYEKRFRDTFNVHPAVHDITRCGDSQLAHVCLTAYRQFVLEKGYDEMTRIINHIETKSLTLTSPYVDAFFDLLTRCGAHLLAKDASFEINRPDICQIYTAYKQLLVTRRDILIALLVAMSEGSIETISCFKYLVLGLE